MSTLFSYKSGAMIFKCQSPFDMFKIILFYVSEHVYPVKLQTFTESV